MLAKLATSHNYSMMQAINKCKAASSAIVSEPIRALESLPRLVLGFLACQNPLKVRASQFVSLSELPTMPTKVCARSLHMSELQRRLSKPAVVLGPGLLPALAARLAS